MQNLHWQRCFTENRFVLTVDSHTEGERSHFSVSILGGWWVPAKQVLCTVSRHPMFLLCHCQLSGKAGSSSRHSERSNHRIIGWKRPLRSSSPTIHQRHHSYSTISWSATSTHFLSLLEIPASQQPSSRNTAPRSGTWAMPQPAPAAASTAASARKGAHKCSHLCPCSGYHALHLSQCCHN